MSKLENFFGRPIGIFNWVFSNNSEECAKLATQHGFSCLQWSFEHGSENIRADAAQDAYRIFTEAGLKVVALSGYQNLVAVDPIHKAKALNILERYLEIASFFPDSTGLATETGTKNPESQWVGHPDNLKPEAWDEMIAQLQPLGEKAKAAGTKLLIEGYVENIVRTADDIERLKAEVDMDAFGFVMDPFNLILEEQVPTHTAETERVFTAMNGHVGIAHAKDLLYTDGVVATPRSGTGMFDMQNYFKLLDEQLPGVPLILEHLKAEEVGETLDYLKQQYELYKNS